MTNQDLEAERARVIADIQAMPGPRPLRPIPPEELAWALNDLPPVEVRVREYQELITAENRPSLEGVLSELDQMVGDAE